MSKAELKKQIESSTNKAVRGLARHILPANLERNALALDELRDIVNNIVDATVAKIELNTLKNQ